MILAGNQRPQVAFKQSCAVQTIVSEQTQVNRKKILIASVLSVGLVTVGCGSLAKESAEAESQRRSGVQNTENAKPVDVAIARTSVLRQQPEYTGTTVPFRSVSLRSQAEGRLLTLNVDVGDAVKGGQVIGQLDDVYLRGCL